MGDRDRPDAVGGRTDLGDHLGEHARGVRVRRIRQTRHRAAAVVVADRADEPHDRAGMSIGSRDDAGLVVGECDRVDAHRRVHDHRVAGGHR